MLRYPPPPPPFMHGILATHVAFSHCYPPLIYYLTERSIFKKCPPTGKSLKKALRSCVQFLLAAESTKFISVISFGKELHKRRERSESRSFRFKRQLPSSVSLSQRSLANRVFRIGLHATASKSSPRKALFSSVQKQSQHQPKDNFLEEHITYQVCLKLMKLG